MADTDVNVTIPKQLKKLSEESPSKTAFIFADKHWNKTVLTWKDVWNTSRKFAAILRRHGIKKGDIVCNNLPNTPERVLTDLGILVAGASPLQGQFMMLNGEDLIRNLKVAECKAIIVDPKHKRGAAPIIKALKYTDPGTKEIKYKDLPHLTCVLEVNVFTDDGISAGDAASRQRFLKTLDAEKEMYEDETITGNDRAYILITSGTTGLVKLVSHLHKSVLAMGRLMSGALSIRPDMIYYNDRPLGWVAGLPVVAIAIGCARVLTDVSCGAAEDIVAHIMKFVTELRCDVSLLLPFEINKVMQAIAAGFKLEKKLPMVVTGGGPLPRALLNAIGIVCDSIGIIYGSTECGFIACQKVTDKTAYQDNCVGKPAKGVNFKVVDDKLKSLPTGEIGEILIQTPTLALGFLNNPEQTKKEFLGDGWLRPGDIVRLDKEGNVFVYCRKSNAILKSGLVIYPGWIESHVNRCPGVIKSVIIDIPDPILHKDIVLCVTSAKDVTIGEKGVIDFCKRTFISSGHPTEAPCIPKRALFFDSIPINANGKVDRKTLQGEVYKRLGIAAPPENH